MLLLINNVIEALAISGNFNGIKLRSRYYKRIIMDTKMPLTSRDVPK